MGYRQLRTTADAWYRSTVYLPDGGLAAASTDARDLSMVVMPALAMEMVCCSMACIPSPVRIQSSLSHASEYSSNSCKAQR